MIRRSVFTWVMLVVGLAVPAFAGGVRTMDTALAELFPEARIGRRTVYLTDAQRKRIEAAARMELPSALLHPYEIVDAGDLPVAVAYFDRHRIRTRSQTLMVAVGMDGAVQQVEVLAFDEPPNYRPPGAWYAAFRGRRLNAALNVGAGIDAVTGATISAQATTRTVRRILAVHGELYGADADGAPR